MTSGGRQLRLWSPPEPGRKHAVFAHLPGAMASFGRLGLTESYLGDVLLHPDIHWERRVRVSRDGKRKPCWSPSDELREVQKILAKHIFQGFGQFQFPATAFAPGMSILRNANYHRVAGSRSSYRVDLKDAFPSVTTGHIASFIRREGFPHANNDAVWVASRVLTFNGRLEQGAPTSPHIFNAMLRRLDQDLLRLIEEELDGAVYTRYADDLCFSCPHDVFPREWERRIRQTIAQHNFAINTKKVRRAHHGKVDLPGILINNGRMRPNGAYVKRLLEVWLKLNDAQKLGHRLYVKQFGRAARMRVFRFRIPLLKRYRYYLRDPR